MMFWNIVQWLLNRFVIGDHYWCRHSEGLIIGFQVTKQEWAGDPNRAGWDYPKGPPSTVGSFLNINGANGLEEKLRLNERGHVCYDIEPIQVRIPELQVLVFCERVRKQIVSIKPRVRNAYQRWAYYRRLRAESRS